MRVVVQRVNKSSVKVDNEIVGSINKGFNVLVGIGKEDTIEDLKYMKDKVLNLTRYNDINDLLIITDVLISDYSSVIFEYALLEKPMIFFAYDLESYVDERNFYYNYEDFVPGPIVKTNDEIINLIKGDNFDLDKVRTFRNEFFEDIDGKSTERLVEFLIKGSLE